MVFYIPAKNVVKDYSAEKVTIMFIIGELISGGFLLMIKTTKLFFLISRFIYAPGTQMI